MVPLNSSVSLNSTGTSISGVQGHLRTLIPSTTPWASPTVPPTTRFQCPANVIGEPAVFGCVLTTTGPTITSTLSPGYSQATGNPGDWMSITVAPAVTFHCSHIHIHRISSFRLPFRALELTIVRKLPTTDICTVTVASCQPTTSFSESGVPRSVCDLLVSGMRHQPLLYVTMTMQSHDFIYRPMCTRQRTSVWRSWGMDIC